MSTHHALIPLAVGVACFGFFTSCGSERDGGDECIPSCGDRVSGDDGCGGTCGPGPDVTHVGPDATSDEDVCAPTCSVATCGQADGCGGTCAACPNEVSCGDCALGLTVVQREGSAARVDLVTVALDYAPAADATLPGIADLRFAVGGDVSLVSVALGQSLVDAKRELAADPETGKPFRQHADGSLQILVLTTQTGAPMPAGRWLFLTFRLGSFGATTPAALSLGLVQREATFAPPLADQALWGASFGTPVVVWSDDVEPTHAP